MPCTPCPNATWPAVPLGVALALLSACAPWAQRPLPATRMDTLAPPAQWQALVPQATVPTPTALADTAWWQHFNDPVLLARQGIDMRSVVRTVFGRSFPSSSLCSIGRTCQTKRRDLGLQRRLQPTAAARELPWASPRGCVV